VVIENGLSLIAIQRNRRRFYMAGRVVVPKVLEFEIHPWGAGSLTNTGVQYSAIFNANVTNTYVNCTGGSFNVIVDKAYPGYNGLLREVELGITAEFQGNATCLMLWKVQGKNLASPTWVDLAPDWEQAVTTAWAANTRSGYALVQDGFNQVPFEVQMQFRTNHATLGIGRIKSSSYIRALYQMN
jgi:hypothetical protein